MARSPSVLFVHDNYPGQFGRLARWLAARGWDVAFATMRPPAAAEGMRILPYRPHRAPAPQTHPYAQPMDRAALKAQAFARAAFKARREGYRPDIVVAHSGWGAGMFAKDIFPEATYVAYCEWWYRFPGEDVAWLAANGYPASPRPEAALHERARNAPIAMDLSAADLAICPTRFQASQFPDVFRERLTVLHDGIDTDLFRPGPAARRSTLGGLVAEDARVVTYATRGMEPHRGFPQFMAAVPGVLAADPRAVVVVAGENRVFYGGDAFRRTDWKAEAMARHGIDPRRVRFTGRLAPQAYLALLRRSDAHVYLTVPFVLSWSMLEAMSAGCAMVVSDTAPVLEFADGEAAALADMARPEALAQAIGATLADAAGAEARRKRARGVVEERARASAHLRRWQALLAA